MAFRVWHRVRDHIGVFGCFVALFLLGVTVQLWRTWPHNGQFTELMAILWIGGYAQVRTLRERVQRREAARRVLEVTRERMTPEEAETIRKGLQ
jgi:hypothetical protein